MYFQNQLKLIATIILCHESNIIIIQNQLNYINYYIPRNATEKHCAVWCGFLVHCVTLSHDYLIHGPVL